MVAESCIEERWQDDISATRLFLQSKNSRVAVFPSLDFHCTINVKMHLPTRILQFLAMNLKSYYVLFHTLRINLRLGT